MKRFWHGLMTLAFCLGVLAIVGMSQTVWAADPGSDRANAIPMTLDEAVLVEIEEVHQEVWYSFTPEEAGFYLIYSEECNMGDPSAELYEGEDEGYLDENDDGGEDGNFFFSVELKAGTSYYLCAHMYGERTGSYSAIIEKRDVHTAADQDDPILIGDNDTQVVEFSQDGAHETWFVVYPETTGRYWIEGGVSSYVFYDSEKQPLGIYDDDEYDEYVLSGDGTYYIRATVYDFDDDTLVVPITLERRAYYNGLDVWCENDPEELVVAEGGSVTLRAEGEWNHGSVTLVWLDPDGNVIPGANDWTYTIDNVTAFGTYTLCVTDEYGDEETVEFPVTMENGLTVSADETYFEVDENEEVTLQVSATCTSGSVSYEWFAMDDEDREWVTIDGVTGNTYTFSAVTDGEYQVEVRDEYGNRKTIEFEVNVIGDLELRATSDTSQECDAGDEITFSVRAVGHDLTGITYQWYEAVYDGEEDEYIREIIAGAESDSLTIQAARGYGRYYCVAALGDFEDEVMFEYDGRSSLRVTTDESNYLYGMPGSQVTLSVEATTNTPPLSYEWYAADAEGERVLIPGASGSSCTVTVPASPTRYWCYVSDKYTSDKDVQFTVRPADVSNAASIRAGETKTVVVKEAGVPTALKFVPEITGNYKIYSAFAEGENIDPLAGLMDESLKQLLYDDDGGSDVNFQMEAKLTAGKTYYILADLYDGNEKTYSVTVENKDSAAVQAEAKDQKAADDVAAVITALKAASGLTLNDKAAVTAARNAYNKLTAAQKAKVPAATLKKLTDAEARIAALEKAAQAKPAQVKKVTSLKITADSNKIAAGKKVQLKLQVLPADAANQAVTWTSSNTKVATVSATGKVTVKKKTGGKSVVITATANDGSGVKATFTIKSMKGVVKKVKISGSKSVKAGKTLKLKAKVNASKGANKKLIWTTSNKKYATVKNGKVKTTKAGKGKKVTITAKATDGSGKKAKVKIKITK